MNTTEGIQDSLSIARIIVDKVKAKLENEEHGDHAIAISHLNFKRIILDIEKIQFLLERISLEL